MLSVPVRVQVAGSVVPDFQILARRVVGELPTACIRTSNRSPAATVRPDTTPPPGISVSVPDTVRASHIDTVPLAASCTLAR